jgi:hypothetical protein
MRRKAAARFREKQQLDPGYAIVPRIDNLRNPKTLEFDYISVRRAGQRQNLKDWFKL